MKHNKRWIFHCLHIRNTFSFCSCHLRFTTEKYPDLLHCFSSNTLEKVALRYFGLSEAQISHSRSNNLGNSEGFNRDLLHRFKNKSNSRKVINLKFTRMHSSRMGNAKSLPYRGFCLAISVREDPCLGVSVQGSFCLGVSRGYSPGGLCLGVFFQASLSRSGLCPVGLSSGGLCPGGLCPGGSVQWVSVLGGLCPGGSS